MSDSSTVSSRERRSPVKWVVKSFKATSRVIRQPRSGRNGAADTAEVSSLQETETAAQQRDFLRNILVTVISATADFQRNIRSHPFGQTIADALGVGTGEADELLGVRNFPQRFAASQYIVPTTSEKSATAPVRSSHQDLTATGSKSWGSWWDGRGLLRIKIYDFAIYVDPAQLATCKLSSGARRRPWRWRGAPRRAMSADFFAQVVSNHDVEMSLTVRPSRDLPLGVLAGEYERILRKRLKNVGGNPEDRALGELLRYFDQAKLPAGTTRRGCIKKDVVLNFCRTRSGTLTAVADGAPLTSVRSHKLCEAIFDLYLGDAPVSKRARSTAGQSMLEMMSQPLVARV